MKRHTRKFFSKFEEKMEPLTPEQVERMSAWRKEQDALEARILRLQARFANAAPDSDDRLIFDALEVYWEEKIF